MGKKADLVISNSIGQVVFRHHFDKVEDVVFPLQLEEENLRDGMYFISIIHVGRAQTKSLIIAAE